MGRLDGKVAIVTGAARGQGEAEARLFAAEGARVVLTDVLDDEGEAVAADISSSLGEVAVYRHLDVREESEWNALVADCVETFGAPTVLVNNAGILFFQQVVNTDVEAFRNLLDINLIGPFLGIKVVAGPMGEAGGGSIINISSTGGLTGMPAVGAYVASKFGLRGLTKTAAMELGSRNIRVNSVHPGSVNTPMVMMEGLTEDDFGPWTDRLFIKRLGTPEDIASMVLFLASEESSYCTGAEFVVDGGQTAGDSGALG